IQLHFTSQQVSVFHANAFHSLSHACSLSSPMAISSGKKKSVLLNMRRPLNRGRQLSSLEPVWPPGSSHYGGGARIEPLWRGSPHHTQTPHETVRRGRKFHFLTHTNN